MVWRSQMETAMASLLRLAARRPAPAPVPKPRRRLRLVKPKAKQGHWAGVPDFLPWFREQAPSRTNAELLAAIKERFGVEVTRAVVTNLRQHYASPMDAETRRKAYSKRQSGASAPPSTDERALIEVKRANVSLLRQLDRARATKAELVEAVYNPARDAVSALEIRPIAKPMSPKSSTTRQSETAILVVSDQQLGKRTPTYSSEICEQRMERYMDKVALLTDMQRADHPVRMARIHLLGDTIEGELVYPGQAHRIDSSLFRQVTVDGPRIISNVIRRALGMFDSVHVVATQGNHGALAGPSRKEMHPESNGDLMLYRIVQTIFETAKQDRLTFDIPYQRGERAWYAVDTIGEHKFFLYHGDQMRGGGFGGLPYYGFGRAINNWAAGVIPEGFKYALCGHWHQMASIPINDRILWVNGSTESSNEWLREELKAQCPPGQWLLYTHPTNGVTSDHRVWLS